MGREATCIAEMGQARHTGRAHLDSEELVFRGDALRFRIPLAAVRSASVADGVLRLEWDGEPVALELGEMAIAWADAIRGRPSLLDKLGVKAGAPVAPIGSFEPAFLRDLTERGARPVEDPAAAGLVLLRADDPEGLERAADLAAALAPGAALWIVAPKGKGSVVPESAVLAAGRAAGLKDVKVARFSATHTAHKFVRARGA